MRISYHLCDVFTARRFEGNPLAVIPHASGLSGEQMQRIAREFNYSETTFVLPPEAGHTRRVRIFTPHDELPFAGHPNIGTAFVLAAIGELGPLEGPTSVVFEEGAGPVPVEIAVQEGRPTRCELAAPEAPSLGAPVEVAMVARAVSLPPGDVITDTHPPRAASVGLPFLFVELVSLDALARAQVDAAGVRGLRAANAPLAICLYVRDAAGADLRVRVLIAEGGYEDPATGSASCALAGLLASLDGTRDGELRWHVRQGVEMGRPSDLYTRVVMRAGGVASVHVAGESVIVGSGTLELG
jgi:trans-2,3-dihydro-3-hydroxyanthranilate isomerase